LREGRIVVIVRDAKCSGSRRGKRKKRRPCSPFANAREAFEGKKEGIFAITAPPTRGRKKGPGKKKRQRAFV